MTFILRVSLFLQPLRFQILEFNCNQATINKDEYKALSHGSFQKTLLCLQTREVLVLAPHSPGFSKFYGYPDDPAAMMSADLRVKAESQDGNTYSALVVSETIPRPKRGLERSRDEASARQEAEESGPVIKQEPSLGGVMIKNETEDEDLEPVPYPGCTKHAEERERAPAKSRKAGPGRMKKQKFNDEVIDLSEEE